MPRLERGGVRDLGFIYDFRASSTEPKLQDYSIYTNKNKTNKTHP